MTALTAVAVVDHPVTAVDAHNLRLLTTGETGDVIRRLTTGIRSGLDHPKRRRALRTLTEAGLVDWRDDEGRAVDPAAADAVWLTEVGMRLFFRQPPAAEAAKGWVAAAWVSMSPTAVAHRDVTDSYWGDRPLVLTPALVGWLRWWGRYVGTVTAGESRTLSRTVFGKNTHVVSVPIYSGPGPITFDAFVTRVRQRFDSFIWFHARHHDRQCAVVFDESKTNPSPPAVVLWAGAASAAVPLDDFLADPSFHTARLDVLNAVG